MWVWQVDTAHHIMVEVHYPCPLFNNSNSDTYEVCTCTIILLYSTTILDLGC